MNLPKSVSQKKGFTLIELIIVIGILGILAVGLLAALDPLEQLKRGRDTNRRRVSTELSGALNAKIGSTSWMKIRNAAKSACHSCSQYEGQLKELEEPAWTMIVHAANEVCGECPLKDLQKICGSCPQVEVLRKLVDSQGGSHGNHH